ncbi:MAG: efflux transporter outer membrane subunit [Thermodesulfobacteriota bacterium]
MHKLLIFFLLFAAGCTAVGPDYTQPKSEVPQGWNQIKDPALLPDRIKITNWWTLFNDPTLNQLIKKATRQNLNLRAAAARVEEARAQLRAARGGYLPEANADGSVSRQESRASALDPDGTLDTYYSAGMDASWELDLFGRIRRSVEASSAEFQATEEDRVDIMISMYAQVAGTYINIRTLQTRIKTALENITSQKEILKLTKSRFKYGLATDLDVAQAEQVLANTKARIPPLRIQLAETKNSLGTLLAQPPGAVDKILEESAPIPLPPERVAAGVPADLLRQRPDIRGAERRLAAQTARIGMATAELYPRFSLVGSIGYMHTDLNDLFIPASRAFSFGPSLGWNIFSGGKLRAQIDVEDARTKQALLTYEQTVLTALSEAENAMTGHIQQKIRLRALQDSVRASKRSLKLSEKLYKDGLSDFQNVLDAQRELFSAEDQLDQARGNAALYMVSLYRALGGGWDPVTRKSGVYSVDKTQEIKTENSADKGEQE